jgi:two-component system invasion response regulator UvrY
MQAPDNLNNMNKLSPREKEVAVHILEGMSTNLIAKKLGLKSNTVSTTKNRIFMKLGVDSNVGLYKMLMG